MDKLRDTNPRKRRKSTRWSNPEFSKYGIVGIICLDKDNMLVLDRNTCSVILLDKRGDLKASYKFNCIPWSMTLFDQYTTAISIPGENKICIIELEFQAFVLQKEIKCSIQPSAITGFQNYFYVASDPWSDKAAIYKLQTDGKIDKVLDKDDSGQPIFVAPLDIAFDKITRDVFVCDSGRKIMFAFDHCLQGKFRIDLDIMGHPSSMTVDGNGDIFICGKLSNLICKVTTSSQSCDIVYSDKDGISRPQAITTVPKYNSLCVLCAKENAFKILKTDSAEDIDSDTDETHETDFQTIFCRNTPPLNFRRVIK